MEPSEGIGPVFYGSLSGPPSVIDVLLIFRSPPAISKPEFTGKTASAG
jgi:hypothetical protein